MKPSKHKLSTPDLELLITNLKSFIVKVEEDKENQKYDMDNYYGCVYAKTMKDQWSPDKVSQILLNKDCCRGSRLLEKVLNLFCGYYFTDELYYTDDYGNRRVTKQQWLEVANKVVLKLEKKLWKRKVKEGAKSLEDNLFVPTTWDDVTMVGSEVIINK